MEGAALLRDRAGVDPRALVESACLDWEELRALARHPLATMGAHTLTHPAPGLLAGSGRAAEMAESRDRLELEFRPECRHFAYPYGDMGSAGPREFALSAELGFETAVTTRPGMIFPEHAGHLLALPRMSVNGLWQDESYFETLLSGAPFALWNRGRRVNVAKLS